MQTINAKVLELEPRVMSVRVAHNTDALNLHGDASSDIIGMEAYLGTDEYAVELLTIERKKTKRESYRALVRDVETDEIRFITLRPTALVVILV